MAEGMIIAPVIEKSLEFVVSHTYQELRYLWKFKNNIQSLSRALTSLEKRREEISLLIDAAKNNAEVIGPTVEEWMQEVDLMKKEVEEIIQGTRNAQMCCSFNCNCLNLKVRYSLSKKAATKTNEIGDIQAKGEFSRVGYPAPIGQRLFTSPLEVFSFESRLQVEERAMKALLDERNLIVAVCGMGGVGKTTMVKKIADEIKKHNHFDEVVMAVVSQNYDPLNVQQQLAENLGLKFEEGTLHARAGRLHARLMDQGKKILLIIDDLWTEIDLRAIGIPSEVERKGLRVLLTSRFSRVCSKMDVKEIIEVGVLTSEESWVLFKKHANISGDDSDVLKGYPKKVADKCQGLPLAIEIIGKTLKDTKNLSDWADAFLELENARVRDISEDMHDKVYSRIAWSVNHLKSQCRSLLLLCSLFPEDYEIEVEDLVRYAKGLLLFEGVEKMAQTRDRVERIVHELADCYLLIVCGKDRVKLHDVVRDTCLRITSEGENVYMVSHSGLTEWPDQDTYESYTAISLDFDDLNELPSVSKYSSLQLLRLSFRGGQIMDIMTSFLQEAERLRVLNLTNSPQSLHPWVKLPPQSLQASISLRTLNLHNCNLVGDLSPLLSSLVKVEVLSFYRSTYEGKWPKEIAKLSNLKSLDLRFLRFPTGSLPTGMLTGLKKLEELYLGLALDMLLPENKQESYEFIVRIGSLSKLNTIETLGCDSDGLAVLVENLDVERLLRFSISSDYKLRYQFRARMKVHDINIDMLLKPKMMVLFSKVNEDLRLERVRGYINDFVKFFDGGIAFSGLKSLKLKDCDMKYICHSMSSHTRAGFFVDLKILKIEEAKHLEGLCSGDIPPESFGRLETLTLTEVPLLSCLWGPIKPPCLGNLTILKIHGSKVIRSLFLGSSVKCFARLRDIEIRDCPKLETLVSCDAQTEKETVENKAQFPELEALWLQNLDSFKAFCSEPEAPKVLLCRTNSNLFPKLRNLDVYGSDSLHLVDVTKNGQILSSLGIWRRSVEVCFDFEGWRKEIARGEVAERVFDNLDSLTLGYLPNLRHLWRNLPEGTVAFQNLTTLTISYCGSLKRLLTPSMAKMLVRLRTLDISSCEELEAIVGPKEIGPLDDFPASNCLVLQNLTALSISSCRRLKHLLSPSMAKMLASLKTLVIDSCEEFEAMVGLDETSPSEKVSACKGEIKFDRLEHLKLQNLPRLKNVRRVIPKGTVAFEKLLTLEINDCGGLKYLFTPPMVKMFVNLKKLKIRDCNEIESIIGSEVVDEAATNEVDHGEEEIVLLELCKLKPKNLPEFRMLCSQPVGLALPSLNDFVIDNCPRINRFCAGNLIAPELKQDCELGKHSISCATSSAAGETCDHLSDGSSGQ